MKHPPRIVAVAVVCALAAACGNESAPKNPPENAAVNQADLEDVLWRLVEYQGDSGEMTAVLDRTTIEIEFLGTEFGGTAGCNRYFGTYSLGEANELIVGSEIGSTQMACPPEVMEQEQRYLALLGQVAMATRVEGHLSLQDAESTILLKFEATESATLENTDWQALGINNGKGGVVSTATTSMSTAVFSEGQLSGSGGCNQFTATYETDGPQITIGPAAATRMLCDEPEGIMDQEQQYFEALERARTFSLTPEKLELRDENGSLQVGFRVVG